MVFIKKESFESLDEHFNSKDMDSDSDIKQEDVGNSADESDCDTMPLSEEAMAWDGLDMEQLEVGQDRAATDSSSLTFSRASSATCATASNVLSTTPTTVIRTSTNKTTITLPESRNSTF